MSDENFIRQFLKHRKFSTKIADNVDEKTRRTTAEQEMDQYRMTQALSLAQTELMELSFQTLTVTGMARNG